MCVIVVYFAYMHIYMHIRGSYCISVCAETHLMWSMFRTPILSLSLSLARARSVSPCLPLSHAINFSRKRTRLYFFGEKERLRKHVGIGSGAGNDGSGEQGRHRWRWRAMSYRWAIGDNLQHADTRDTRKSINLECRHVPTRESQVLTYIQGSC